MKLYIRKMGAGSKIVREYKHLFYSFIDIANKKGIAQLGAEQTFSLNIFNTRRFSAIKFNCGYATDATKAVKAIHILPCNLFVWYIYIETIGHNISQQNVTVILKKSSPCWVLRVVEQKSQVRHPNQKKIFQLRIP